MAQNESNFRVGLTTYLVPLRGPRMGPEVQNPATSGFLGLAGCRPRMSQITNDSAIDGSLCLRQLFFQMTQPTDCFPPGSAL